MKPLHNLFFEAISPTDCISDKCHELFDNTLAQKELNNETILMNYYKMADVNFNWDYDFIWSGTTIAVEKTIVRQVKTILESIGMEAHLNNICSILQELNYRKLIALLNKENINFRGDFEKEFYQFYQLLDKELEEIIFLTNRKNETCSIRNKNLIKLIKLSIVESILKDNDNAIDTICEVKHNNLYDDKLKNNITNAGTINLLIYIQTLTNFRYNRTQEQINSKSFSNKQFELIFDLMVAGSIIEEQNVTSLPKDYIGVIVRRAFASSPYLLDYFLLGNTAPKQESLRILSADEMETFKYNEYFELQMKKQQEIKNEIENLLNQ